MDVPAPPQDNGVPIQPAQVPVPTPAVSPNVQQVNVPNQEQTTQPLQNPITNTAQPSGSQVSIEQQPQSQIEKEPLINQDTSADGFIQPKRDRSPVQQKPLKANMVNIPTSEEQAASTQTQQVTAPIPQAKTIQQKVKQPRKVQTPELTKIFTQDTVDPVGYINVLLGECVILSASDILFEPREDTVVIRARIDGVLYELGRADHAIYDFLIARLKVLSKLDTASKNKVQEGQFVFDEQGKIVNMRVEIVQTVHGEMAVIRLHELSTIVMDLAQLGFSETAYNNYQKLITQRSGLLLVCGPTGCGKTTTLYTTITKLNEANDYNIMTIENPVEFQLDGINQMQTHEESGFTFAAGLHTILRLSPDVVFVGEIRDLQTAKIAVESGLTGHLVFSTIHAEDAVGALFRMRDLGIESYLLNSSLVGILSQRLVRVNCPNCLAPYTPTQEEVDLFTKVMGRPPGSLSASKGCGQCNNLAFKGRIGIFEVLTMDSNLRNQIRDQVNEDELRTQLLSKGHVSLLKDGLIKCEMGITTVNEVLRNSLVVD